MNEIDGVTRAMQGDKDPEQSEINTINEYALWFGRNLPNHSTSLVGKGAFVRQSLPEVPTFRTRQGAYRYAAYLVTMADLLPDDDGQEGITFDDVLSAIQNT